MSEGYGHHRSLSVDGFHSLICLVTACGMGRCSCKGRVHLLLCALANWVNHECFEHRWLVICFCCSSVFGRCLSRPHIQGVMLEFERKKKSLAGWSPQTSSQSHVLHNALCKHVSLGASVGKFSMLWRL